MPSSGYGPKSAIQAAPSTAVERAAGPTDGQLQTITATAPTHVVKTVVNQKQAPA